MAQISGSAAPTTEGKSQAWLDEIFARIETQSKKLDTSRTNGTGYIWVCCISRSGSEDEDEGDEGHENGEEWVLHVEIEHGWLKTEFEINGADKYTTSDWLALADGKEPKDDTLGKGDEFRVLGPTVTFSINGGGMHVSVPMKEFAEPLRLAIEEAVSDELLFAAEPQTETL